MKANKNIENKIIKTLEVADTFKKVNAPPFFKDKTMQLLFTEEKEIVSVSFWNFFTPKLQLATLVCVIMVNVYAIKQVSNAEYEASISSFASEYGITSENNSSIFNL